MTIAAEINRLEHEVGYMLRGGGYEIEVPMRLHEHGPDAGHGLGGPKFTTAFLRWISAGGCTCDEPPVKGHEPGCGRINANRFRPSLHRNNPQRLHKALRYLRAINPVAFDPVFLMLARGLSWEDAYARINAGREQHGQLPHSRTDFAVITIAGLSLAAERF